MTPPPTRFESSLRFPFLRFMFFMVDSVGLSDWSHVRSVQRFPGGLKMRLASRRQCSTRKGVHRRRRDTRAPRFAIKSPRNGQTMAGRARVRPRCTIGKPPAHHARQLCTIRKPPVHRRGSCARSVMGVCISAATVALSVIRAPLMHGPIARSVTGLRISAAVAAR